MRKNQRGKSTAKENFLQTVCITWSKRKIKRQTIKSGAFYLKTEVKLSNYSIQSRFNGKSFMYFLYFPWNCSCWVFFGSTPTQWTRFLHLHPTLHWYIKFLKFIDLKIYIHTKKIKQTKIHIQYKYTCTCMYVQRYYKRWCV